MVKAHEIQGCIALENSFNKVGLDHVLLVKLASTAVVGQLLGLTRDELINAVSLAVVDGHPLRTYRHAPNTGSRKSWAAGDATSRAVRLALIAKTGEMGYPSALTAKTWGFYDVLFKGADSGFQRPYGSYVMENVLFKISFPAEFHAQTAVEAAMSLHAQLARTGRRVEDIRRITIRTHEAALRIIDKKGPLDNPADRDHCIQYMVAVPLIHGRLTAPDYEDPVAQDPRIDCCATGSNASKTRNSRGITTTGQTFDRQCVDRRIRRRVDVRRNRRRISGRPPTPPRRRNPAVDREIPNQSRPPLPREAAKGDSRCIARSVAARSHAGQRIRRSVRGLIRNRSGKTHGPHLHKTLKEFDSGSGKGKFYSLPQLGKALNVKIDRLPVSIRIVLESVTAQL